MRKFPKSRSVSFRKYLGAGIKVALLAESLALIGTYFLWNRMNSSRDFRYRVYNIAPVILESYYWVGEKVGGLTTRQADFNAWGLPMKK